MILRIAISQLTTITVLTNWMHLGQSRYRVCSTLWRYFGIFSRYVKQHQEIYRSAFGRISFFLDSAAKSPFLPQKTGRLSSRLTNVYKIGSSISVMAPQSASQQYLILDTTRPTWLFPMDLPGPLATPGIVFILIVSSYCRRACFDVQERGVVETWGHIWHIYRGVTRLSRIVLDVCVYIWKEVERLGLRRLSRIHRAHQIRTTKLGDFRGLKHQLGLWIIWKQKCLKRRWIAGSAIGKVWASLRISGGSGVKCTLWVRGLNLNSYAATNRLQRTFRSFLNFLLMISTSNVFRWSSPAIYVALGLCNPHALVYCWGPDPHITPRPNACQCLFVAKPWPIAVADFHSRIVNPSAHVGAVQSAASGLVLDI